MTRRDQTQAFVFAISPLAYVPFAQWMSTTPVGTGLFIEAEILYFLVLLVCVFAIPVLLFRLGDPSKRSNAKFCLMLSAVFIPCCVGGLALGHYVRMAGMASFANRSKPLVTAIESYVSDHAQPPETLEALVPDYIDEVPWTGMMAYPKYRYVTGVDAQQLYGGNPWVLTVETPSGGINFDAMFYFPLQNYPKHGHGGMLKPIGEWAYLHE